jgi:outer membrane protein assembly factor BamB
MWGSPMIADGKMYIGNADGDVYVFEVSKKKNVIAKNNMGTGVLSSALYANGVLYIMTGPRLYAIQEKK